MTGQLIYDEDYAEGAHSFEPCTLPHHKDGCCYVSGYLTHCHVDEGNTYEASEHLARHMIRRMALVSARRVA